MRKGVKTAQQGINKNIDETLSCYQKLLEKMQKPIKIMNSAHVGTLEGLTREIVKKYNIPADDNVTREILDQEYIEPMSYLENINGG